MSGAIGGAVVELSHLLMGFTMQTSCGRTRCASTSSRHTRPPALRTSSPCVCDRGRQACTEYSVVGSGHTGVTIAACPPLRRWPSVPGLRWYSVLYVERGQGQWWKPSPNCWVSAFQSFSGTFRTTDPLFRGNGGCRYVRFVS